MPAMLEFTHHWRVRFVDTDASGFAHFSSYVKMMEETEYAFLRSRGLSVVWQDQRGILGFPRVSAKVQIHQPLRAEQSVEIRLRIVEIDGKQISYDFVLVVENGSTAATGTFVVAVCRFLDNQPPYAVLIPADVEVALLGLL